MMAPREGNGWFPRCACEGCEPDEIEFPRGGPSSQTLRSEDIVALLNREGPDGGHLSFSHCADLTEQFAAKRNSRVAFEREPVPVHLPGGDDCGCDVTQALTGESAALPAPDPREPPQLAPQLALVTAARNARLAEARDALAALLAAGIRPETVLDRKSLKYVRRAAKLDDAYQHCFDMDQPETWSTERAAGIDTGYRLKNGTLRILCGVDCHACSSLGLVAALLEGDLCQGYISNATNAVRMSDHCSAKSIFRVHTKSFLGATDSVVEVVLVDALDEASGCVTVGFVLPGQGDLAEACCAPVPAPDPGCARLQNTQIIFRVTPLDGLEGGCRLSMAVWGQPTGGLLGLLAHTPAFAVRMTAANKARELAVALVRHASTSPELQLRVRKSTRSHLYAELGRRLARRPGGSQPAVFTGISEKAFGSRNGFPPLTMTPEASSAYSPSELCTSSASASSAFGFPDCPQSSKKTLSASNPSIDDIPWEVLSQELPEDWAD